MTPQTRSDFVLQSDAEPLPGYRLVERLGGGGFGEVWKALAPGGFSVALKFVRLEADIDTPELRALDLIRDIRHANLLLTFGAWRIPGYLLIAMELADRTLMDRFREARNEGLPGIPRDELLEYFREAAKGIDYLNEPRHTVGGKERVGIQHRDIKPQNILLVGGGVKVADFGLARFLESTVGSHSGSMTPAYAPPEFFKGQTSNQSDQYSLAVTYCQLRGGLPFAGTHAQIVAGHLMHPPDLTMLAEEERPAVARALAKEPGERWPSCRAFVEALQAAKVEAVSSVPTPVLLSDSGVRTDHAVDTKKDRRAVRREFAGHRKLLAAGGLGLLVAIGATLWGSGIFAPAGEVSSLPQAAAETPSVSVPEKRADPDSAPPPKPEPARRGPGSLKLFVPGDIAVKPGMNTLDLSVQRLGVEGPVELSFKNLPPEVGFKTATVPADKSDFQIMLDVSDKAEWGIHQARIVAHCDGVDAETVLGITVGSRPKLTLIAPDLVLEAGEKKTVTWKVDRTGSPYAARVTFEGCPPGVTITGKLKPGGEPAGDQLEAEVSVAPDAKHAGREVEVIFRQRVSLFQPVLGEGKVLVVVKAAKEITNSIGMKLVLIPAGEFQMGTPDSQTGDPDEKPRHPVRITTPFYIGAYEVTQGEYESVMDSKPSYFSPTGNGKNKVAADTRRFPVEMVSWEKAVQFCKLLSERPAEKAARRVYRLPTEAEWEYACRAGTDTSYYCGNDAAQLGRFAWYKGNAEDTTHEVGIKEPNAWGLYDMAGNVWEWCEDWYRKDCYQRIGPVVDPKGPEGPANGSDRVRRGGSWIDMGFRCRSAERSAASVEENCYGFRVVCVIDSP